ncbi:MAG: hemin receptor [Prevotella sp.]|jgi:hypothetical protein|nr:hemin receptor [Prevotella sp.]
MKTKYILVALVLGAVPAAAQETYQDAKLMETDLNGTARYIGMGGAMEALGADLSTMSSNPAGIGLFRKSAVNITGGLGIQSDAKTSFSANGIDDFHFKGHSTIPSFDQAGFVWSSRAGRNSYLNFGFNYHKSRNFDQILSATNTLSNASQNKLTAMKNRALPKDAEWAWNGVDNNYSQVMNSTTDANGNKDYDYLNGTAYAFGQYSHGYIGEYDFNISGNINDRVFLGFTFGIHDVHYNSQSYYTENLEQNSFSENWEHLRITGTGYDAKFGAIFRPVESSPFRIGVYVNTPVFYDLTLNGSNDLTMTGPDDKGKMVSASPSDPSYADYDFKIYTPWKFGVSLGETVGNYLALGATYEYADYGSIDNRVNDGSYTDWYGDYYDDSHSDGKMNDNTEDVLKGVSTIKLGLEYKPIQEVAFRIGYNYLSPMFEKDGIRDGSLESPGVATAMSTDYTNWKSTNRFTFGVGYELKQFTLDLAYQYSQTNGDFYPFMSYTDDTDKANDNIATGTKVSNKRHQLALTIGYRF